MSQNFYEQLGVSSTASQGEILESYRSRLRKALPDVRINPDHHVVRGLNVAYTVLSDPGNRRKYDQALSSEFCPWCGQPLPAYGLEHHVATHAARDAEEGCIVCGRLPVRRFKYAASSGFLGKRVPDVDGNLCKTCATGVFREVQANNVIRGPWGPISFFSTPYNLARNWGSHRKTAALSGPIPDDPVYDGGSGLSRAVFKRTAVWVSLLAMTTLLIFVAQAVLSNVGQSAAEDREVTSTTIEVDEAWSVGSCARIDPAGRPLPTSCDGDHYATVVALVAIPSECPETSDWSIPVDEGVACFEET